MLTHLTVRRFKLFEEVSIELGERVVLIGPNNSGKSSVLQAIALWEVGTKRWLERRGTRQAPRKRRGVALNRRDLVSVPVMSTDFLWHKMRLREGQKKEGRSITKNIVIEISVSGETKGEVWECGMEFDYANSELVYCRPLRTENGESMAVPPIVKEVRVAYLPPMSGLVSNEVRLEPGAIQVRLGEGRSAEVLRNLCLRVYENSPEDWEHIQNEMQRLFGVQLESPNYVPERGEIQLFYRDLRHAGTRLEIQSAGRGQQQTLLLLAHMYAHPGTALLMDEPDAHLEILRQRQAYNLITTVAEKTQSQLICASHSEVVLNEAAQRDLVIAFIGKPHRIDDRGSQLAKALKEIGFEDYYLAEQKGWVLYLEGSTDLAILQEFSKVLQHPAYEVLQQPFVKYVGNQPSKARDHFYGLREAKKDLKGIAIFDRLDAECPDPHLQILSWSRREIENYFCTEITLLGYARRLAMSGSLGALEVSFMEDRMHEAIQEVRDALKVLGKPDPFGGDLKVSDEFLPRVFDIFFENLGLSSRFRKTDFHILASYMPKEKVDPEVSEYLDKIFALAEECETV